MKYFCNLFLIFVIGFFGSLASASVPAISFTQIQSGTFKMGSPDTEAGRLSDEYMHNVTISHSFEIGTFDVTQLQWVQVMGSNPSNFQKQQYCQSDFSSVGGIDLCPNNPVETVSWNDTQTFLTKLSSLDSSYTYRLPTEAEWEYAARAGTQTSYYFGDDANLLSLNVWFYNNSNGEAHVVGTKTANSFGLYDMSGNVYQWVQDWYNSNYYRSSPPSDPKGPSSGVMRIFRGGSWLTDNPGYLRSALRGAYWPNKPGKSFIGFRIIRVGR